MANTATGKIMGDLLPYALLGVGAIVLIKNPQLLGKLVGGVGDWFGKALGAGNGNNTPAPTPTPTNTGGGTNLTVLNTNPFATYADAGLTQPEWWKGAIPPLYFWDILMQIANGGNKNQAGGSPTPTTNDGKSTPNTPAFKASGNVTVSPWTNQQAISWIQQENRIWGSGGFLLTEKGKQDRLKNFLGR